ncbi:MAG: hypothetical protein K1X83_06735 [Oligoflexia bacterium]|nr:hypothetical protein [Oligoflexia bacterium]
MKVTTSLLLVLTITILFYPPAALAYQALSGCMNISQPGEYRLTTDLPSGGATCLNVTANGSAQNPIIIDGRNPTTGAIHFVSGINIAGRSQVKILYARVGAFSGAGSSNILIDHVQFEDVSGSLNYLAMDGITDFTVTYSKMSGGRVFDQDSCSTNTYRPPQRITFTHNTVIGKAQNDSPLFDFRGGACPRPITTNGVTESRCPVTSITISDNIFTSNNPFTESGGGATINTYLRCARGNTVQNNRFVSLGGAAGLWLRDDGSDNQIINNYVETDIAGRGAMPLTSGTIGYKQDSGNVYRNNIVRAKHGLAINHQSIGEGNEFYNNIYWSSGCFDWNEYGSNIIRVSNGLTLPTIFDHNTFYTDVAGHCAAAFMTSIKDADHGKIRFTNNLLARPTPSNDGYPILNSIMLCDSSTPSAIQAHYEGNNNLFWIPALAPSICGQSLSGWKSVVAPHDSNSTVVDPLLTFTTITDSFGETRPMIRLAAGSPACSQNQTYIGAYPCSGDNTAPTAPSNLRQTS